jgi:hypothetical protein
MIESSAAAALSAPAPHEQILGVVNAHWQGRAVAVAAELEMADLLADGPLHLDALAERTKTDPSSLFRLLRALESTGIFTQVSPHVFANTPASECLRKNVPGSQWAWVRTCLSTDAIAFDGWTGLMHAVKTGGIAFDQVCGCSVWDYLQRNPQKGAIFNEAMRSLSASITPTVAASYDWSRFPVIADIAGGIGTQLVAILDAHPGCRGILFDKPHVVTGAMRHERVEIIGGDFFDSVPAGADAYMLRWIIHDWAEPKALAILDSVRKAMKSGARLVLIESVIPDTPDFDMGKWMDVNMLVMVGGRERTATEYGELYAKAGFELEQIIPTLSPLSIIIGRPRPE